MYTRLLKSGRIKDVESVNGREVIPCILNTGLFEESEDELKGRA